MAPKKDNTTTASKVEAAKTAPDADTKTEVELKPPSEVIQDALRLFGKGVNNSSKRDQQRAIARALAVRSELTKPLLAALVTKYHPDVAVHLEAVKTVSMDTEEDASVAAADQEADAPKADAVLLPEIKAFVHLLVTLYIVDSKQHEAAVTSVDALVEFITSFNRRSMDVLSGKVFFYYALCHEKNGQLSSFSNKLFTFHRKACLQHNEPAQAALSNAILRIFVEASQFGQADKFRLNSTFPESASNAQLARYLFYVGFIQSVQLNYSDAYDNLTQALRKAPTTGVAALGFRQAATRLSIIVQLLTGEIPERAVFNEQHLKKSLFPYFQLTSAVRVGDLGEFNAVVKKYQQGFAQDRTLSLIGRLRHNVIKAGLRKINIAYSRISLQDVCEKLKLDSVENAEYIIAKAIHDGVIDAALDRKEKFMYSKKTEDIYLTSDPRVEFHKRIQFCLRVRNDAIKAMTFRENAHKTKAEIKAEQDLRDKEEDEYEGQLDPEDQLG